MVVYEKILIMVGTENSELLPKKITNNHYHLQNYLSQNFVYFRRGVINSVLSNVQYFKLASPLQYMW